MVQPKGTRVTLEAPQDVRIDDAKLKFVGWVIGGRQERSRTVSLTLDDAIKAVAYYEGEEAAPGSKASPLHVALTATVAQSCVHRLTHDVTLSWKITGGRPPVRIEAHLTYPDRHVENVGLKPIEGVQDFPISVPDGGGLHVGIVATDVGKATSSAETTVKLISCDQAQAPE